MEEEINALKSDVKMLKYIVWYLAAVTTLGTGKEIAAPVISIILTLLKGGW